MSENLFYLLLLFFAFIYFMRALLLAGYANLQVKKSSLYRDLFQNLIKLKPLLQRNLPSRNIEFKIYSRFLRKSEIYYITLWVTLTVLMFFIAKLFFGLF